MITVEQARALGWQRVEFNDGLGFRLCTAVCAWNPEFQYRAVGTSHVILDIDGTRVLCPPAYANTLYRNTHLTHKWTLNDHVFNAEPVFISTDVYYAVKIKQQIKFEDLPLGTTLRHKSPVLSTTEYAFRGVDRFNDKVYAERRTRDFVRLEDYPRSSWHLSPDQSWLPLGIDIPKGLMMIRHANGYWWRIVKLEEGYELV